MGLRGEMRVKNHELETRVAIHGGNGRGNAASSGNASVCSRVLDAAFKDIVEPPPYDAKVVSFCLQTGPRLGGGEGGRDEIEPDDGEALLREDTV